MATNSQNCATLFECEHCSRLFQSMEVFIHHSCDNPESGGYDAETLAKEDASLDLEGEEGGPIELAPDSSVLWNRPATLLLIQQYQINQDLVNSGKMRKKALWVKISKALQEKGNKFNSQQVEGRWKTLMRGLKNVKDHNKKSGADKRTHPFEDELEFMSEKPNVNPEYVLSTDTAAPPKPSSDEASSSADRPDTPSASSKRKRPASPNASTSQKSPKGSKSKTVDVVKSLEELIKSENERTEEQVERRHRERMDMFSSFLDILKSNTK